MPSQSNHNSSFSQGYQEDSEQPPAGRLGDMLYTVEQCFNGYQGSIMQYWADHGLRMNHSDSGVAPLPASASTTSHADQAVALPSPYLILPQEDYVARRRFQQLPPIVFQTATTDYVRLEDAMNGSLSQLQGIDDTVFSGDNLSQKQSLRLEIVGCKPYERQINVRNPTNNARPITRGRLAEKVAKEIFDFVKRHQTGPLGDSALTLGPGTKGFERLVLIELRHVSRSSWQPILGVIQCASF